MKYKARKLLSLFLAFVLVCGTIPAAFASGNTGDGGTGGTTEPTTPSEVVHTDDHTLKYTNNNNGTHTIECETAGCTYTKQENVSCTYGTATVTKEATCTENGTKESTCTALSLIHI